MQENERYCNIVRDKIFTGNEEKENETELEENKPQKNNNINLECHKIVNTQDEHTKFAIELQNLINFVKERSYYRDLNGNRITSNGKMMPTPYQKLEKINEDIRNFYENKLNKKSTTLIIENSRKRNFKINPNLNIIDASKNKSKNSFSSEKYSKSKEKPVFTKILTNSKSVKNKSIQSNISLMTNNNIIELIPPSEQIIGSIANSNNKCNKICLTENYKTQNGRHFPNFKTFNFWEEKMLNKNLNKNNDIENISQNNTKNSQYLTEYIKKNKEKLNNLLFRINKNDLNNIINKNKKSLKYNYKSKTRDFSSEINKYELLKSNMDKLLKADKVKSQFEINTRLSTDNFINKKTSENKFNTISMDMNRTKSFRINKNLTLKNKEFKKNNCYDNIDKYKTINDKDFNKYKKFKSFDIHKFRMKIYY